MLGLRSLPIFEAMKVQFEYLGQSYACDLMEAHDISIPLAAGDGRLSAWYVPPISIEPVRANGFVGAVAEGGSVNFRNIGFNPHGHGTHTECVGHIAHEVYSVNTALEQRLFVAQVVTVEPAILREDFDNGRAGDCVIRASDLPDELPEALVLRTAPNSASKTTCAYSNTNPPYLLAEAASKIVSLGVEHLLIDLPSVDREVDGGELRAHHLFWGWPAHPRKRATITELIYVDDGIEDGLYLLNLQTAPFENDATPSRPVLYKAIRR